MVLHMNKNLATELHQSLVNENQRFNQQLILNPVENVFNSKYYDTNLAFLHGVYNSDKIRSADQMLNTKIQFANREFVASDINKVYQAWCKLLNSEAISMRFFSGLHAHTTVFMAITEIGDNVVILPEKAGGHMATKAILSRLGLNVYELIIDYEQMRIDIEKSCDLIVQVNPKVIFIDRSEGTIYEDFSWLKQFKNSYKIFDASQYLTNIISGDYISPFEQGFDAILSTTHKNFPGPQRALYCTKKIDSMWEKLYSQIGTYVSNMHPYSIYTLGFMLEDLDYFRNISKNMIDNAINLSKELKKTGFDIITQKQVNKTEKNTHHIWACFPDKKAAFSAYKCWEKYGFLTNYRLLPYDIGYGIRIGLSAATVSGLRTADISSLALLLCRCQQKEESETILQDEINNFIFKIKENSGVK